MSPALDIVLTVLGGVLALAGGPLFGLVGPLLYKSVKAGLARTATEWLVEAVKVAVLEANAVMLPRLIAAKRGSSPGGTKITPEEGAAIKAAVVARIKEILGKKLGMAVSSLGSGAVEAQISASVEKEVAEAKRKHAESLATTAQGELARTIAAGPIAAGDQLFQRGDDK